MNAVCDLSSTAHKPSRPRSSAAGLFWVCFLSLITLLAGCSGSDPVQPYSVDMEQGGQSTHPGETLHSGGSEQECPEAGASEPGFELEAKYSYIRSYPGGGGVFVLRINTSEDFVGNVYLTLEAEAVLNAAIYRSVLNSDSRIAEVMIRPVRDIEPGTYRINVIASYVDAPDPSGARVVGTVSLDVEVIPWGSPISEYAEVKKDELVEWVEQVHPEYGDFSRQKWLPYMTYPGILVVEHWTFLSEEWEMRVCFHVMIPPYDWSKILLRERGEWEPTFAAIREYNGTEYETQEIPVSDYPTFYGY